MNFYILKTEISVVFTLYVSLVANDWIDCNSMLFCKSGVLLSDFTDIFLCNLFFLRLVLLDYLISLSDSEVMLQNSHL